MVANSQTSLPQVENYVNEIIRGSGYVVLTDLLTPEEASMARDLVLQRAEVERQRGELDRTDAKERLYGLIYLGDVFLKMVEHPKILQIATAILGNSLILGGFSAHILHQGATRMGIHVDYPYWAMQPPFPTHPVLEIQTIWLVEDFTEDNGAPLFVPGSQQLATTPDRDVFTERAIKLTGKAGSVIISHGLCWHDTSINQTPTPRVSILGNYTQKFIRPLEDPLYNSRSEILEAASPQLKHLLRYDLKSDRQPIYPLWD